MESPFTEKLMDWNRQSNYRSMPWKGEKDPYKIWLSEIMLQQTRVEQGLRYYEKFITVFPTIQQLALAPDEEVYKLWEGLGYYSRCKNLLQTARTIHFDFQGVFPTAYNDIIKLKGVGVYTAAAISSFAFNQAHAVVDGNVQRVMARYFGITTPVDTVKGKALFQELASELLDKKRPGVYNQAIMDFGATICKPQNPLCHQCIQQKECVAYSKGFIEMLPVKEKSLQRKKRWLYYFLVEINEKVYIRKRIEKDIWQNLHEFVLFESSTPVEISFQEHFFLRRLFPSGGYEISHISRLYKQQLTHQDIQGKFIVMRVASEVALHDYILVEKKRLKHYAFPKFIKQFLLES
jgi:A/G-specific adenine glycosylase